MSKRQLQASNLIADEVKVRKLAGDAASGGHTSIANAAITKSAAITTATISNLKYIQVNGQVIAYGQLSVTTGATTAGSTISFAAPVPPKQNFTAATQADGDATVASATDVSIAANTGGNKLLTITLTPGGTSTYTGTFRVMYDL